MKKSGKLGVAEHEQRNIALLATATASQLHAGASSEGVLQVMHDYISPKYPLAAESATCGEGGLIL